MVEIFAIKQQLGSCHDILLRNNIRKVGSNYLCPFHEEKNSSFSVYDNGQKFKCHSCGVFGDAIDLQAHFDGIDTSTELKKFFQKKAVSTSPELIYLSSRGIDLSVVDKFLIVEKGYVGLNIRNGNLDVIGQQKRSIHEKKFLIAKGGNTGIFFENDNPGGGDLFITEGVFDFLTMRQATPHVLGYVSATSHGTDIQNIVLKYRNIYWLGDQDKPGEALKQNFLKLYPDLNIYELPKVKEKMDVNDLLRETPKEEVIQCLKEICVLYREGDITTVKDHARQILHDIKNFKGIPFTWGSRGRDLVLGILNRGQYNVLVGEAGAGKTEFSFYLSRENARRGHKILYISLEMTTRGLLERYAEKKAGVTREELLDANIPPYKLKKIEECLENMPENIEFWGAQGVSVDEIRKKLFRRKYDMVFIDNFGFMDDASKEEDKYQEISRQLVNLKKGNNACIIAMHHFRKDSGRKGTRALQDLRGSAKIGDDVDLAIHYCRACKDVFEKEEDKYACMLRILKDRRHGDLSEFQLFFKAGEFVDTF